MIWLSSRFFKRKRKEILGPILKYREDGEFPLHIKDQRDYHSGFKVYFRMSVAQFDALLAILEPHIKRKTTNFCELSVMKWMNLTIAILDFDVRLYSGSELSKHSKCLPRMRKKEKIPIQIFYDRVNSFSFLGSV